MIIRNLSRHILAALSLVAPFATLSAQTPPNSDSAAPPPAAPADVKSADAILHAAYEVVSGPPGPRDWRRFASLFAAGARLIATRHDSTGAHLRFLTPDTYAQLAGKAFMKIGFFEQEIGRESNSFGVVTQVFSVYATRHTAADPQPFLRGINSFQLFDDGTRWYIVSIFWDDERAGVTIPDRYIGTTH
jgi:hypothetical protein